MELKEGYKQIEVGVIPEDWETKRLSELVTFINGKAHENYIKDDGQYIVVNSKFISSEGLVRKYTDYCLVSSEIGSILMVMSDVPKGRAIAKCFMVDKDNCYAINQRICSLKAKSDNPRFLFYLINRNEYFLAFDDGVQQTNLRKDDILGCPLSIPPTINEQTAVATALSDVDALISSLAKLVIKKQNIKQGVMQLLLTGKKRLPGFSGDWETKKLGELLDYEQPGKYIVKNTEYTDNGDTPVLTANKGFILGYTNETEGIYKNIPVIIFDDFTTDSKYVDFPFKVKSSAIKLLKTKDDKSDLRFVFGKMQLIGFSLGDHKRYYISEYQHLEIFIPDIKEQTAITQVLSDIESEIEELEYKLAKYKMTKQGMMQELLTGNKRLI